MHLLSCSSLLAKADSLLFRMNPSTLHHTVPARQNYKTAQHASSSPPPPSPRPHPPPLKLCWPCSQGERVVRSATSISARYPRLPFQRTIPVTWRGRGVCCMGNSLPSILTYPGFALCLCGYVYISMQDAQLSDQIRPWYTLGCCWDVKQATSYGVTLTGRNRNKFSYCGETSMT